MLTGPRVPALGGAVTAVASLSAEKMDQQGIRKIDDIARLTPSLRFVKTSGVTGNNGANISIRGIASDVGAATTARTIETDDRSEGSERWQPMTTTR